MNNHTIAHLDDAELAFLKQYRPADDMVTSPAEKGEVIRQLSLMDKDKEQLQAMRNAVVHMFDKDGISMVGMQSVTAVIDHRMLMLEQADKY